MVTYKTEKNDKPVICSPSLFLPSGRKYHLKSFVSHIGENTRSGHYNVTVNDTESGEQILLDDSRVMYLAENSTFSSSKLSYIFVYEVDD